MANRALTVAASLLVLAGCGGSDADDTTRAGATTDATAAVDDTFDEIDDTFDEIDDSFDVPDGFPLADSIEPGLAAFPIPDPAIFSPALDYDAATDPRESLSQTVYSTLPMSQLIEFYLDALPAAGFDFRAGGGGIESAADIEPDGLDNFLDMETPDGQPAQLVFAGQSNLSTSQVQLVVFRAG